MGPGQAEPEVRADAVGRRVSCGGERATVRYVGPVPTTPGLWIGVEWDHPERGKHDGSHGGVRFFTCRHPGGGSFLRPEKVSFGEDYLTVVQQVYRTDSEETQRDADAIDVQWTRVKERSLTDRPSVLLSRSEVNGPGDDGDVRRTTPNVLHLNLCGTLLSCWDDVAAISRQLDQLTKLDLSSTRLTLPSDLSAHLQAFCSLKVLVLNNCDLTWPQILELAPLWPRLENLSVEGNAIRELHRPDGVLQSLRDLSLVGNPLAQDSVISLAALPRLENLNLSQTGLSEFPVDDAAPGGQSASFPALTSLSLEDNVISEWRVVDELAKLSGLVILRCHRNRLVTSDGNSKTVRQLIIAKLGRLAFLDGVEISPKERRGAEIDYIKMFGEEWLKAGGGGQPSSQFTCQHPRYLSLINRYGAPEEGELRKSSAWKNQLLKITFTFPDDANRKSIDKKLPASMQVQKVKGLLHRLLKVPVADLRLSYTTPKVGVEYEINNDLRPLQFYSIADGDQMLARWS
ncbi:tubulin-specific chaperone E isoform X2 [Brachionichthys hirsutus]|uniref:tubulin-specific chaperone E isoform X2 n=1 Tax=Brachionichthys hirsutus TaxID=412623 RepID=UPI003605399F